MDKLGKVFGWLLTIGGALYVLFGLSPFLSAEVRSSLAELWLLSTWRVVVVVGEPLLPGILFVILGHPIGRAFSYVMRGADSAAKRAIAAKPAILERPAQPSDSTVTNTGRVGVDWPSTRTVSKLLVVVGLLLIGVACTMDTTVSTGYGRVHNLHLGNQQNMVLFVGGLFFLAGVILFATSKQKQLSEGQAKQETELASSQNEAQEVFQRSTLSAMAILGAAWMHVSTHFSRPDGTGSRLLTGVFVGLSLALLLVGISHLAGISGSFAWFLVVLVTVWLAFRPIPAARAMRQLLGVNAIVFLALGALLVFERIVMSGGSVDGASIENWLMLVSPAFISVFYYLLIGYRSRNE